MLDARKILADLQHQAERAAHELSYTQPGKPQQNAYVERYNGNIRQEWRGQHLFETIEEARHHATR